MLQFHIDQSVGGFFLCMLHMQVGIILILEAVVFPFVCGWWMDICSFVSLRVCILVYYQYGTLCM